MTGSRCEGTRAASAAAVAPAPAHHGTHSAATAAVFNVVGGAQPAAPAGAVPDLFTAPAIPS